MYKTKQRDLVLNCITECKGNHITADDIVTILKQQNTPVGKSTVYRYLNILVEEGVVRKYVIEEGSSACYQYDSEHVACNSHYHLKCNNCGELFHADCVLLNRMEQEIYELYSFKVDNTKTVLYGQCMKCACAANS